ncbi:hypothetical protein R5R35_008941 [Gryllus longicercus]|uniref:Aminopeptidase N n=1 Tax=Gryllus longicercus TaxID=2509291 RepID=A0AAN9YTC7_9ORTH
MSVETPPPPPPVANNAAGAGPPPPPLPPKHEAPPPPPPDAGPAQQSSAGCYVSRSAAVAMAFAYLLSLLVVGMAVFQWTRPGDAATAAVWAPADPPPAPRRASAPRLPTHVRPTYYRIRLMPFLSPGNFTAAGEVWVWLNCSEAARNVTLNVNELEVELASAALLELPEGAEEGAEQPHGNPVVVRGFSLHSDHQTLTVLLMRELAAGRRYVLHLRYTAHLNDLLQGFYRSSYVDDATGQTRWLASTQFSPTDARRAFPCFDEPSFKARFQLSLARPSHLGTLSNMPLDATEPIEGMPGWWWDHYPATLPMSTYLVAFVESDLVGQVSTLGSSQRKSAITSRDVQFRVWSRRAAAPHTRYAARFGPRALRFLEDYFALPFPLPKQDMVAVPDFGFSAMENWGLITFRESAMLFDANSSTEANKEQVAYVIGHEISHQWFGNLVTPKWWNDLWLKEGFATYMGYKATAYVEPTWRVEHQFINKILHNVFALDALESSHPISVPVDHPDQIRQIFDSISYEKGASLIRMMSHFLGEDTFRSGLSNYLEEFKYSNTQQDDLWESLTTQAHLDGSLPTHVTVDRIMDTWTLQVGYPVVNVMRDYNKNAATISQQIFLLNGEIEIMKNYIMPTWWVPLTFTTQDNPDFNTTRPRFWLENTPSVDIEGLPDENSWILFNLQQTGYYRVNYDNHNWGLLTNEFLHLPDVTRMQLLDDAFNLARAGHLSYAIALNLTKQLSNDEEYLPWAAATPVLGYLKDMLALSPIYGNFKTMVLKTLENLYNKLEFDERASDTHLERLNRVNILEWACNLGQEQCVWHARAKFRLWMSQDNRKITDNPISPNQKAVVYCTAIKYGGNDEWDFAWKKYLSANLGSEKETLLDALGCSSQPWLLNRYLNWMLSNDSGIRKQDGPRVFNSVSQNVMGHSLAFNFLRNNWEDILDYYGLAFARVSSMVSSLATYMNTQLQLEELMKFREENAGNLGTTDLAFKQTIEKVKSNIRWMEKSNKEVDEWLKMYISP